MSIDNYLKQTIKNNKLHKINKNVYLTTYEINILTTNKIDYKRCSSYKEILFFIEEVLENLQDEQLEQISLSISERNYYQNTHK